MPQAADFPIAMALVRADRLMDTIHAVTDEEIESLVEKGYVMVDRQREVVEWPKLLRHPDGKEVTVNGPEELKAKQDEGFGFPRDIPRPVVDKAPETVSAKDFQNMRNVLEGKLEDRDAAHKAELAELRAMVEGLTPDTGAEPLSDEVPDSKDRDPRKGSRKK